MIDISREAVEKSCAQADFGLLPDQPMSDLCRALLARVEELEATHNRNLDIQQGLRARIIETRRTARLQGLDEAKRLLVSYGNGTTGFAFDFAKQIEALKDQRHD